MMHRSGKYRCQLSNIVFSIKDYRHKDSATRRLFRSRFESRLASSVSTCTVPVLTRLLSRSTQPPSPSFGRVLEPSPRDPLRVFAIRALPPVTLVALSGYHDHLGGSLCGTVQ